MRSVFIAILLILALVLPASAQHTEIDVGPSAVGFYSGTKYVEYDNTQVANSTDQTTFYNAYLDTISRVNSAMNADGAPSTVLTNNGAFVSTHHPMILYVAQDSDGDSFAFEGTSYSCGSLATGVTGTTASASTTYHTTIILACLNRVPSNWLTGSAYGLKNLLSHETGHAAGFAHNYVQAGGYPPGGQGVLDTEPSSHIMGNDTDYVSALTTIRTTDARRFRAAWDSSVGMPTGWNAETIQVQTLPGGASWAITPKTSQTQSASQAGRSRISYTHYKLFKYSVNHQLYSQGEFNTNNTDLITECTHGLVPTIYGRDGSSNDMVDPMACLTNTFYPNIGGTNFDAIGSVVYEDPATVQGVCAKMYVTSIGGDKFIGELCIGHYTY